MVPGICILAALGRIQRRFGSPPVGLNQWNPPLVGCTPSTVGMLATAIKQGRPMSGWLTPGTHFISMCWPI